MLTIKLFIGAFFIIFRVPSYWYIVASLFQTLPVLPDGLAQSHIQGVADKGVADAHLVKPRYAPVEIMRVNQTEVVAGVEAQTSLPCSLGGLNERLYGLLAVGEIVGCIRLGVQFHAVGATHGGPFHRLHTGSTNMEVRMPTSLKRPITSVRKVRCSRVSHPWLLVIWLSPSGTSVTCVGFTSSTRSMYLSMGFPSMLNSVVTRGLMSLTSWYLMCLSSGRGCTVMPCAPNFSQ